MDPEKGPVFAFWRLAAHLRDDRPYQNRCRLLFTKPKPKHWPNATTDKTHSSVIGYLSFLNHKIHVLYEKI